MTNFKLSIIIVHFHTPELLRLCLRSIRDTVKTDYEVLIADSEADPDTETDLRQEFPSPAGEIIYQPFRQNIGYAKGINWGIEHSQGEYILILNPDIILAPNAVAELRKFLDTNPTVGLVGPRLVNFNGKTQNSAARFYRPFTIVFRRTWLGKLGFAKKQLAKFNYEEQDKNQVFYPDWIQGSALMTRRSAIARVGKLDENFFLYFEDVDWCRRFWENGLRVAYYPLATVFHYHQRQSRAGLDIFDYLIRKETRWHVRSGWHYFRKHGWHYQSGTELLPPR